MQQSVENVSCNKTSVIRVSKLNSHDTKRAHFTVFVNSVQKDFRTEGYEASKAEYHLKKYIQNWSIERFHWLVVLI